MTVMISLSSRSLQDFGLSCAKWVSLRPAKVLILIRPPRSFTASKYNCSYQATIEMHMQPENPKSENISWDNTTCHIQSHSITIGHKMRLSRYELPARWKLTSRKNGIVRSSGKTLLGHLRDLQLFMWQGNWQSATVWLIGLTCHSMRYVSWGSNFAMQKSFETMEVLCWLATYESVEGSLESWLRNLC